MSLRNNLNNSVELVGISRHEDVGVHRLRPSVDGMLAYEPKNERPSKPAKKIIVRQIKLNEMTCDDCANELKAFVHEEMDATDNELLKNFNNENLFKLACEESKNNAESKKLEKVFLALMRKLVKLKTAMHEQRDSTLDSVGKEMFKQFVVLVETVVSSKQKCYINSEEKYMNRAEKIIAIRGAVTVATQFISSSNTIRDITLFNQGEALLVAAEKMRKVIEGPAIFRREKRALCGTVGAIIMLVGIVSAVFVPYVGIPLLALLACAVLFSLGAYMLSHAIYPEMGHCAAKKIEHERSRQSASSLKNLVTTASNLTFFSPADTGASSVGSAGYSPLRITKTNT